MLRKWMYLQDISPFKIGDIIETDDKMHIMDAKWGFKYFLITLTHMDIDIYDYIIPIDIWRNRKIDEILSE